MVEVLDRPSTLTIGNSAEASYVAKQGRENRRGLQDSSLGLGGKGVFSELYRVVEECGSPNWDGYGAYPVTKAALWNAYCFLEALPLGIPSPAVGAEPDGHLTIEWYRNPHWTLSVSVSPEGVLYYAALFGAADVRGSEIFSGEVPEIIFNLIRQVRIT